jgi:sugar lactone lactonase YvrE
VQDVHLVPYDHIAVISHVMSIFQVNEINNYFWVPSMIKSEARKLLAIFKRNLVAIGLVVFTVMLSSCGGSGAKAPTPTPTPILSTLRIEAEAATLLGSVLTFEEAGASNGSVVGNLSVIGDGIEVPNVQASISLTLSYAAETSGTLSVMDSGVEIAEFSLVATGSLETYSTSNLVVEIEQGTTISLSLSAPGAMTQIDYIEFNPSPLQVVTTPINISFNEGGGVSVSAEGDIYISGGPTVNSIISVTPEGEASVSTSGFTSVNGSGFDSLGDLFLADYQGNTVYRIAADGNHTVFASDPNGPASVYVDKNVNVIVGIYSANFSGTGSTVLGFAPDGSKKTLATGGGLRDVIGVVGDENGEIYAGNFNTGSLYRVTDGNVSLVASVGPGLNQIDYSRGYVYIASRPQRRVFRVSLNGIVEIFSGSAASETINSPVGVADYVGPNSLAFSQGGNISYGLDSANGKIGAIFANEQTPISVDL